MNENKLLPNLSQNLLEILNDDEYYDITIEVGTDPYKDDETLSHIKLSNISPEIFEIILRYIYGGKISLNDYDNSDIIKVLVAANELNLQELVIYLQSFLIKNKKTWMEENFNFVYKTSFENNSFSELQNYCTGLITEEPDKIFKSPDFTSIPENLLISIVQNDNLKTSEVHIWENVLKWGFAQNPELPSEIANFSNDDLNTLKNTLKQCIPFIRLYDLTSKEFVDKVFPYREILPEGLCAYLLETFLTLSNPESRGVERNDRGRNDKVEDKDDTKWRNFRDRRSEERYDNHHNSMRKYDIRPSSESKAENSNNIRTLTTNTYTSLPMRKKLELKPRSSAAPNENVASRPSKPNPFGEAKPIDTDEAFRRVEERRRKQKKRNVDDYWF
ncbi:BTB/POZ protein [Rhizophagus irregularis DAOM 181602=DAOM 197198]|nr:BTB/POZ protein [Rhizophagus irregularis DAOM 181602=DAOM 197198]